MELCTGIFDVLCYAFHDTRGRETSFGVVIPAFLHCLTNCVQALCFIHFFKSKKISFKNWTYLMISPVFLDARTNFLCHNIFLHFLEWGMRSNLQKKMYKSLNWFQWLFHVFLNNVPQFQMARYSLIQFHCGQYISRRVPYCTARKKY